MPKDLLTTILSIVTLAAGSAFTFGLIRAGLYFGRNEQKTQGVINGLAQLNATMQRATESADRCFEKIEQQLSDLNARVFVLEDRRLTWRKQADGQ